MQEFPFIYPFLLQVYGQCKVAIYISKMNRVVRLYKYNCVIRPGKKQQQQQEEIQEAWLIWLLLSKLDSQDRFCLFLIKKNMISKIQYLVKRDWDVVQSKTILCFMHILYFSA